MKKYNLYTRGILFLIVLSIFQTFYPAVILAQSVSNSRNSIRSTEYTKNGELMVPNKEYRDSKVKKLKTLPPLPLVKSPYELGGGVDPLEKVGNNSKVIQEENKVSQKTFTPTDIENLKESQNTQKRIVDEYKEEYTTNEGIKIVEKSLKKKFEKEGTTFKEISGKPILNDEKVLTDNTGNLDVTYNKLSEGVEIKSESSSSVKFKPINSNDVTSEDIDGDVIYRNIWEGVDIVYEYLGDAIKEYIIVNKYIKNSVFEFEVEGAKAINSPDVKNGIDLTLEDGSPMYIEPLYVIAKEIGPVSEDIVSQEVIEGNKIRVTLNNDWLSKLSTNNFPVAIDPGIIWGTRGVSNGTAYSSYKSNGYTCNYVYCDINIGGLNDGGQKAWRSVAYMDYSELFGKNILGAYVDMYMSTKTYRWNGFYNTNARINVAWASCFGFNCIGSGSPTAYTYMTTSGTVDVTSIVKWLVSNNMQGGYLIFWGEENRADTFKAFDAAYMKLNYAYNYTPNNNATVNSPLNNSVITSGYPTLSINGATDPDNDALKYNFVLKDTNGTILQQSTYTPSLSMAVADGVLQDKSTYTWSAFVRDDYHQHSSPSFTSTFKTDFRTGKDTTQTYDEAGPFAVNLSNGNAYTANSTHSMNALGGSIGISLDYNTPQIGVEGLSAKYWNNSTRSGDPIYTRVDSNINFNWGTSSPFPGLIITDKFSAEWFGYFIAPVAGSYKFGVNADDGFSIILDGVTFFNSNCCSENWSSSINFTEGQVVKFKVKYSELTSGAKAILRIQMPDGTKKVMPSEYFRTAPINTFNTNGLTGKYYIDDGSHVFSSGLPRFLLRNEANVNYDWGTNAFITGGPSDNILVKYEGYLTVPLSGNYNFEVSGDDGYRLYLNGTKIVDDWANHVVTTKTSSNISLNAGSVNKIVLEYYEATSTASISLKWKGPISSNPIVIENKYLSPEANILPSGWNLSLNSSGYIPFESLMVKSNSDVVMLTSDGTESLYTYKDGGYKPPVNEDGWLVKNSDNTYTFTDTAGGVYVYDALDNSGKYKLKESSTPYDDKNPAGLIYEYSSVGGYPKLKRIIDSVDPSRFGVIYYQGENECISGSGDYAVPTGYLCAFSTTDGNWTRFNYYKQKLSRIEYPGNASFEYGYFEDGRISSLRDSQMIDTIVAGLRNGSEQGASYNFTYDVIGRMDKIYLPSLTGDSTIQHSFEYLPRSSKQHIIGAVEPVGYSKYIEYDNLYRTTKLCDNLGLCSTTEWDASKDIILSSTTPTNLKSTTIYDLDDRPLENYGPAPTSWFGSDRKPLAQYLTQVPRVETKYDEGFIGGSVAYYQVKGTTLFGSPKLHTFGINPSNKALVAFDYTNQSFPITKSTGMDGVGLSLNGKVSFPQNATYTFKSNSTDGVRLYIDDKLIVDNWSNKSSTQVLKTGTFTAVSGKVYRVRLDWITFNATPKLDVKLSGSGIAESNLWSNLTPGYNLATTNIVYDQQIGNVESKTTYQDPAYGIIESSVLDPNGLNYSASVSYEPQGSGYFRQLSKTTPGGATTNYTYYGATEQVDNPCTLESDLVSQAGFIKSKLEVDPDGNGSQTSRSVQSIYDKSGRVVASKINNENWTCTNYDARGRVTSKLIPDNNGKSGKTLVNNYAFGDNPLKRSISDGTTTILTEYDFLGNLIKYTDSTANATTYEYDSLGRLVTRSNIVTIEKWVYNDYSQIVQKKIRDDVYASVVYDSYGRVQTITYPKSGQLAYLGTERDSLDRPVKYNWRQSNGTLISEELTKSQSGLILTQKFTRGSTILNQEYSYDKAGRLIGADYGDREYSYSFDSATNCEFTNSNKNFNRTSDTLTINGVSTTNNYCYDIADKLVSGDGFSNITYDSHGNTTRINNIYFEYDISDQNISVTEGSNTITYTRDVLGRIIVSNFNNGSEIKKYVYDSNSSSPVIVKNNSNVVIEKNVSLPGIGFRYYNTGVIEYSISSSTGNVLATNSSEIRRYDPFGVQIDFTNIYGFGGSVLRETESRFSIAFIQMGARVYIPKIGRFIQVDPIEGGTQNDYVYPLDPINSSDFKGEDQQIFGFLGSLVYAAVGLVVIGLVTIINNDSGSSLSLDYLAVMQDLFTINSFEESVTSSVVTQTQPPRRSCIPSNEQVKKPSVQDKKLQNYVNDFYKGFDNPAKIGRGVTSDAVRNELMSGLSTHGRWHTEKAQTLQRGLEKWITKHYGDAISSDMDVALEMLDDIIDAFKCKPIN